MTHTLRTTLALSALLILSVSAHAQPQRDRMNPGDRNASPRERLAERNLANADPAMLRGRLEEALAESEALSERLRNAIDRLEAGDPPEEVMADALPRAMGFLRQMQDPNAERQGRPGNRLDIPGPDGETQPDAADRRPRPMSPEQIAALADRIEPRFPWLAENLRRGEGQGPGGRMSTFLAARANELLELEARDPDLAALKFEETRIRIEGAGLVRQFRQAKASGDADQLEQANANIRDMIGRQFDNRVRQQELELERLARRITAIEESLEDRADRRSDFIDEKAAEFIDRLERDGRPSQARPPRER